MDHGYVFLLPQGMDQPELTATGRGQVNGLCGAALPGVLSLVVALSVGLVPLRVELLDIAPPASGMAEAHDMVRSEGEPVMDRYLLQLWPAPPRPDAVLRQTSPVASYWHRAAAAVPPPSSSEQAR
ncbi:MAG: hypothetical protein ACTHQ3_23890 [Motilibacteraceae bacterium]